MNIETGELKRLADIDESEMHKFMSINESLITKLQAETEQVSKYDNKSELGKLFTGNRKERREREKLLKKLVSNGKK